MRTPFVGADRLRRGIPDRCATAGRQHVLLSGPHRVHELQYRGAQRVLGVGIRTDVDLPQPRGHQIVGQAGTGDPFEDLLGQRQGGLTCGHIVHAGGAHLLGAFAFLPLGQLLFQGDRLAGEHLNARLGSAPREVDQCEGEGDEDSGDRADEDRGEEAEQRDDELDALDLDTDLEDAVVVVEWGEGRLPDDVDALAIAIERPSGTDLEAEDAVRLDLSYVENWSLIGDVAIVMKSAKAALLGRAAR